MSRRFITANRAQSFLLPPSIDDRKNKKFVYGALYAVEVKAEENLRAKSLATLLRNNPEPRGIRFSMSDYRRQERMENIPLYLAEEWFRSIGT